MHNDDIYPPGIRPGDTSHISRQSGRAGKVQDFGEGLIVFAGWSIIGAIVLAVIALAALALGLRYDPTPLQWFAVSLILIAGASVDRG